MGKTKENRKSELKKSLEKNQGYEVPADYPEIRAKLNISDEDVKKRAFEIYLERGELPGSPEVDWVRAEAELIREKSSNLKKAK